MTAEQQRANRAHFERFAAGTFIVGDAIVEDICIPALSPAEAYPGIATEAQWAPLAALRIERVTAVTGSLSGAADMVILFDRLLEEGQTLSPGYWSVAPYVGPTPPGENASFECGAVSVSPENVVRTLYGGQGGFESVYGLGESEVISAIAEAQTRVAPLEATQESFLRPYGIADDVVGPVAWPPPPTEISEPDDETAD